LRSNCQFYSFQRGPQHTELMTLRGDREVIDTARHSARIIQTAADISHMDLMITVDTMVAHLAGALGRPIWVMLPFNADWLWTSQREDSAWYPTMRLFRQRSPGCWGPVVGRVVEELRKLPAA